jgi:hypothetical protein
MYSKKPFTLVVLLFLAALAALSGEAQRGPDPGPFRRTPALGEFPRWENKAGFERDVFTFVRIRYSSAGGFGRGSRWNNDYPDSDLNFSYRLQQMTSLKVDPDGRVIELSSPELFDHPFIYLIAPGRWEIDANETQSLRRYLLNGGFVMMDDFWGKESVDNVLEQMRKVFPDREARELPLEHPIFRTVFPLSEKPQVPDIRSWRAGYSYEPRHGDMRDHAPHFLGFFDDRGRLVALLCHNNDLGDGWEREGENEDYFRQFSERWSYPMGINILMYVMTH